MWAKGKNGAISHQGNVGINTDMPSEALSVHGNIKSVEILRESTIFTAFRVTGTTVHPSDKRIKEDIVPIDTKKQLENVSNIRLYNYNLKEDWAETAHRSNAVNNFIINT